MKPLVTRVCKKCGEEKNIEEYRKVYFPNWRDLVTEE